MPVSFMFAYAHPFYTALQTEKSMKSIKSNSSCHYGNTENSLVIVCAPMINQ